MSETHANSAHADVIVVGAGIAGVSVAAECARYARVLLLEMESHPGMHATGRSAAYFAPSYGNDVVRGITRASEGFFRDPPQPFFPAPVLRPRECVFVGRQDQVATLAQMRAEIDVLQPFAISQLVQHVPVFRPDYAEAALRDVSGGDLDVDQLLQGFLRRFTHSGGELRTGCEVNEIQKRDKCWQLRCGAETFSAPVIVNAAGAWADTLAARAGLDALGISPKRRTALLVDPPPDMPIADWPLVIDADEEFYFKPDAGQLLLSPADETSVDACDIQPDEWDIAVAIDRVTKALDLPVRRVNHSWAGLRSFAPDKTFVVGEDERAEGFFWLAGQGGYGVQAAPGLARLACHLITGESLCEQESGLLAYTERVSPSRLMG